MKKIFQTLMIVLLTASYASAQTDFVPGATVLFEDNFSRDPVGDFPAKWNTSGEGQVVMIDGAKWLKISQPSAVSPALKKALPENCTIEFDVYMKSTTAIAPHIMFGVTPLASVASSDVYRRNIHVTMEGYNEDGSLTYAKNIQELGQKKFDLGGYVERPLHVSISLNGTRFRVYLDEQKVVDLPKLLTPDYRKNFFVACAEVIPAAEEGVYISNVRIASGDADARSLLIQQLLTEGSATTDAIQFNPQTNDLTPASQPVVDQLGQAMQQNPDLNVQVNTVAQTTTPDATTDITGQPINTETLQVQAKKIKAYLVSKFKVKANRILTDTKTQVVNAVQKNKAVGKAKKLLTEFVKL
jgi:OOP family OmpA-OmpF porin